MKQYLKQYLDKKDLATALTSNPVETKDFYRMAYVNGDYVGVIRGFDSKDEMEADELGAIFCAKAGYRPPQKDVASPPLVSAPDGFRYSRVSPVVVSVTVNVNSTVVSEP